MPEQMKSAPVPAEAPTPNGSNAQEDYSIPGSETLSIEKLAELARVFDADVSRESIQKPGAPFPIEAYMPELPKVARLSTEEEGLAETAGRWVNDFVSFALRASPMTPSLFHQSFALCLLSTAIARRVNIQVGKQCIYPNLYMLIVAQSTLYAKTTGLEVALDLLDMAGLASLTLPTGVTPQSLITELTNRTPPTFNDWNQDDKNDWQKERQFAAQRAWLMDEAAGLLDLFKQKNTADLLTLILKLYNCPNKLPASTIGRGRETVRYAYLTICGPTTPAAMRTHLKNPDLWGNGLFARFLLVTPDSPPVRAFYPEAISIPVELAKHLNALAFTRLPMPIENALGTTHAPPAIKAIIPDQVWKRWDAYHEGIWELLTKKKVPEKLSSIYGRFATTAAKIAMLLAASDWVEEGEEQSLTIQPVHWMRAQMITEQYRASFHRLMEEISVPSADEDQELANKVLDRIGSSNRNSRRELAQDFNMKAGFQRDRLEKVVDQLTRDGYILEKEVKGKRGPSTKRLSLVE
jgi:hypothetical protein